MLKIGDFSRVAQVSVKTLRYYAELGLLRPAWTDRYTGYRYYALHQLPRLNRILALKELGFSLDEIRSLVRDDLPAGELQRLMRQKQAELQRQVEEEQARLARVEARLRQVEQDGRWPGHEVLLKRVEARHVAGIRATLSSFAEVGELIGELAAALYEGRVPLAASGPFLAIYHDPEYRDQEVDVEVAVPVERPGQGPVREPARREPARRGPLRRAQRPEAWQAPEPGQAWGRVQLHELPVVPAMASVVHQGSYESLGRAYRSIVAWAEGNRYRTGGPAREVYLQGPETGLDPAGYVTEVQWPVERLAVLGPNQKGEITMEPEIVVKPAFTVVGLPFTGFNTAEAPNNEIGKLWDQFNQRASEIPGARGPAYGLCFGMPNADEPWYLAGLEVDRVERLPEGMASRSVPEQKYAVFPCSLDAIGSTYRHIMEEWQPRTGFQHADAPDFELYGEDFDAGAPGGGRLYIYWPIK